VEDLERYLDEIVDPTIKDFEQNPTSVRHAFLACVVTFHAIDYLAYPRKSRTLRQQFQKASPDFAHVDEVAHAFKHVAVGGRGNPKLRAHEVISRPPFIWGVGVWGKSRWGGGGVTLDREPDVDLLEVVKRAAAFLRHQLEAPRPVTVGRRRKRTAAGSASA
jgi:hypothetical protein